MEGRMILEALPIESYVPADVMHMLDDVDYFEQHPRYRHMTQPRYPLAATAPPFRPASWRSQSIASPVPMQVARRHSTRSARIAALPEAPFDDAAAPTTPEIPPAIANLSTIAASVEPTALYRELSRFLTPSGPRMTGEGTQEQLQGITHTVRVSEGLEFVYMTLLVAGFVIGPSGESVRSVMSVSGTYIYSCTDVVRGRKCRIFFVEGKQSCVQNAISIIQKAVDRYKDLAEGKFEGVQVDKIQTVQGIDFTYHPPPRSQVPFAAGLRTEKTERPKRTTKRERGSQRQRTVPVTQQGNPVAAALSESRAEFEHQDGGSIIFE